MGKQCMKRRAANAAGSAQAVVEALLGESWIDAKVWQMVWAIYLYPDVPRDLEVLRPKARRTAEDVETGIFIEVGIVGASDYIKIWLKDKPVVLIILACGGSIDLLDGKPVLRVGYRRLLNLTKKGVPLRFKGGRVWYSGRVTFRPFNEGYVHANLRAIWFAVRFLLTGRAQELTNRRKCYRRRRDSPLTVVSLDYAVEGDWLVIRVRTEHEYPHRKKHLDKIVFTEEVIRIWLGRGRPPRDRK